jgi:hypothetical protein
MTEKSVIIDGGYVDIIDVDVSVEDWKPSIEGDI